MRTEGTTFTLIDGRVYCDDKILEGSKKYGERNDCTVVALARVAELPYEDAHRTLTDAGRRRGGRFKFFQWLENQFMFYRKEPLVFGEYKAVPVKMDKRSISLGQIRRDFPKGRLLARKRGHAFAIIDGVAHQACGGDRVQVLKLWYFEKEIA